MILYNYLTPEAFLMLNELIFLGMEPELALAYLESHCGEEIYDIPIAPEELSERGVCNEAA